jgi:adenosylcobinamide-GDP ribazoletransferase
MAQLARRLQRLPSDTRDSLAFFSRLPMPGGSVAANLHASAGAWPLAGLLVALVPAAILCVLRGAGIPGLVAAAVALATLSALTGGLHEDGLADTADGFGGGAGRDSKLAIMRDSRIGSFGALALVFTVLVRTAALALLAFDPGQGAVALLCVAVLSRAAALWHWHQLLPARADGLGAGAGRPDWLALLVGIAAGIVAVIVLAAFFGGAALFALALAVLTVIAFTIFARRQIGGYTGDTVGAAQQVAETVLFAGLSAAWMPVVVLPAI